MKKWIIGCLLTVVSGITFGQQAMGEVHGYIKNKAGDPVNYAHVYIKDMDKVYQVRSGIDGSFRISAIPAGSYFLNVQLGIDTLKNVEIVVPMDGICRVGDLALGEKVQEIDDIIIRAGVNDLKLIDGNLPVLKITAEDIKNSPSRFDPKGMLTASSSEIRMTDDGDLVFRGARKGDMLYMIDGIKSREVNTVPSCAIGNMMVYTGGLPAKYGDTLGGVVVMETKSYFDLYREWYGEQLRAGKL